MELVVTDIKSILEFNKNVARLYLDTKLKIKNAIMTFDLKSHWRNTANSFTFPSMAIR